MFSCRLTQPNHVPGWDLNSVFSSLFCYGVSTFHSTHARTHAHTHTHTSHDTHITRHTHTSHITHHTTHTSHDTHIRVWYEIL